MRTRLTLGLVLALVSSVTQASGPKTVHREGETHGGDYKEMINGLIAADADFVTYVVLNQSFIPLQLNEAESGQKLGVYFLVTDILHKLSKMSAIVNESGPKPITFHNPDQREAIRKDFQNTMLEIYTDLTGPFAEQLPQISRPQLFSLITDLAEGSDDHLGVKQLILPTDDVLRATGNPNVREMLNFAPTERIHINCEGYELLMKVEPLKKALILHELINFQGLEVGVEKSLYAISLTYLNDLLNQAAALNMRQ